LPERYRDHPLQGGWKGYREAHIEPDWLLIYRVTGDELHLVRTGTHADLFDG
jgi:mRNA interferase YafQ